jgi:hypothetical protein
MSELKATPGPWWFHHDHPTSQTIAHVYAQGEHEITGEICTLYACENVPSFNAALIAAAPELYEALEKAAEVFRSYQSHHEANRHTDKAERNKFYAEQMEAALAKARGETNE